MSTHTPGPWTACFRDENARTHIGSWIFVHNNYSIVPIARVTEKNQAASANARLIAAAPEMLKALKVLVAMYGDNSASMDNARAAIAKAEGHL